MQCRLFIFTGLYWQGRNTARRNQHGVSDPVCTAHYQQEYPLSNTLIAQVEELIRGKESTFSAFVVAAVRAAVEEVQNQQDSDR